MERQFRLRQRAQVAPSRQPNLELIHPRRFATEKLVFNWAGLRNCVFHQRHNKKSYFSWLCRDVVESCLGPYLQPSRSSFLLKYELREKKKLMVGHLEEAQLIDHHLILDYRQDSSTYHYVFTVPSLDPRGQLEPGLGGCLITPTGRRIRRLYYPSQSYDSFSFTSSGFRFLDEWVILLRYQQVVIFRDHPDSRHDLTFISAFSIPIGRDIQVRAGPTGPEIIILHRGNLLQVYDLTGNIIATQLPVAGDPEWEGFLLDGVGRYLFYSATQIYLPPRSQVLTIPAGHIRHVFLSWTGELFVVTVDPHFVLRYG